MNPDDLIQGGRGAGPGGVPSTPGGRASGAGPGGGPDDDTLARIIREAALAYESARARGEEVTREHVEQFFRVKSGGKYGLADMTDINARNMLRSVIQGATFNFSDELLGLIDPAAGAESAFRQRMFREEHPFAAAGGEIVGGVAGLPGVGGLRLAGQGVRTALSAGTAGQAAARGAAYAGTMGALAGAGAGSTPGERARGAAFGGAVGAGVGAALPPVIALGKNLLFGAPQARKIIQEEVSQAGGRDAVLRRAQEFEAAGLGDETTLADVVPTLRGAAARAAQESPDQHIAMSLQLAERADKALTRTIDEARRLLPSESAVLRSARLEKSRKAWEKVAYDGLRANNQALKDPAVFEQYLSQPEVNRIWREAEKLGLIGDPPTFAGITIVVPGTPAGAIVTPAGRPAIPAVPPQANVRPPSFEQMHDVVQRLDEAATRAFRKGHGSLGEKLGEVHAAVKGLLEDAVPDFAAVNAQNRYLRSLEEALEAGREAFKSQEPAELAQAIAALQPHQIQEFRHGIASEFLAQLGRMKSSPTALAKDIPNMQAKLNAIFGSKADFEQFLKRVKLEREFERTKRAIGEPRAGALRPETQGEAAARAVASGSVLRYGVRALRAAGRATLGRTQESAHRAVADVLSTPGVQNFPGLLDAQLSDPALIPPTLQAILGGGLLGVRGPVQGR